MCIRDRLTGVSVGSDAFFPFGDNIERAHRSGVQYIAQPGGSIRDDNVIETCNKYGLSLIHIFYFARPDSVIEGASVHEARLRAGAFLALEHPVQADVVIGVPDSGLDAALGFSQQSGIPYGRCV